MPNNYFQFKQFTVQQDKCAMKVCTDACLFGAWAVEMITAAQPSSILDIGAGTGLLSLMFAQKTNAAIDTVEIEQNAFLQAAENFETSPWKERLQVIHTDITQYNPGKKYDLIISNPPFFEDDLKSPGQNKNAAKHDSTLTLQILLQKTKTLLEEDGMFAVLLPFHRTEYFISICKRAGLFCKQQTLVKQTPAHSYFRSMLLFTCNETTAKETTIIIKEKDGSYSEDFTALLKDYYLYL